MIKSKLLVSALLLLGLTASAFGAGHKPGELTTFQETFLAYYTGETNKLVDLAEAFSEDGMDWRPAEGIRSVREAILHVAGGNYGIGSRISGAKLPEGINPRQFAKTITTKADTVQTLKDSIAFFKKAVKGMDEASLNEKINLFGGEVPRMQGVILLGGHNFEHLGQLIAYARSSGVVPPWSQ